MVPHQRHCVRNSTGQEDHYKNEIESISDTTTHGESSPLSLPSQPLSGDPSAASPANSSSDGGSTPSPLVEIPTTTTDEGVTANALVPPEFVRRETIVLFDFGTTARGDDGASSSS
jgi:hypothetical protein